MKLPGHSSAKIANELLSHADDKDVLVSPLKIIKLAYLSHGWMLGIYQKPLLYESIEAWRYGPVIPQLYQQVKQFGSNPITGPLREPKGQQDLAQEESEIVQETFDLYRKYNAIELSQLTHAVNTPWYITFQKHGQNAIISNDLIEHHFGRLYEQYSVSG